jgi:hypothetical protein
MNINFEKVKEVIITDQHGIFIDRFTLASTSYVKPDNILTLRKMDNKFEDYIKDVKKQLTCNASEDYKNNYITYDYSNEQVKTNLHYFKQSMENGLSAYKALLFFGDYLKGEYKF